ncbi:hypothetical protein VTO73DRAFT_6159 [Trametes versicolor]
MVLDTGRIVEFGKPSELLQNEKGMLRALVDESDCTSTRRHVKHSSINVTAIHAVHGARARRCCPGIFDLLHDLCDSGRRASPVRTHIACS